jgi:dolichyl-diphosphooligosaccharide---protein glycosyltransferase
MAKVTSSSANATANAGVNAPTEGATAAAAEEDFSNSLYSYAWIGLIGYAFIIIIYNAYRIRMGAIDEFGPVIHEFDPYFNYRATEVSLGL